MLRRSTQPSEATEPLLLNVNNHHQARSCNSRGILRSSQLNYSILQLLFVMSAQIFKKALLEIIANSDRRHGLELDCNQEAPLVPGARPLIKFNSFCLAMVSIGGK